MAENHKNGIPIYTSGITNLVTITAAGLAASTALMQIAGPDAFNRWWYLWALVAFFIGLIFCFLTMSGLTGQAKLNKPNIDIINIRLPALISFGLACIGFILMGVGAFSVPDKKETYNISPILLKLESCKGEVGITPEKRLKCYDSFFEAQ